MPLVACPPVVSFSGNALVDKPPVVPFSENALVDKPPVAPHNHPCMQPPHRKTVHRWHEAGQAHEFTFSCFQRRPLLLEDQRPLFLARGIDAAMQSQNAELIAFVFMPEHVHLLILPRDPKFVPGNLLKAIKRPVSYWIKESLRHEDSLLLAELTIRERPGKETFRFWQEGGG
ncbi:MAG: transposase, partial [Fimbriimonas ginsengisoli]|nr:transposase [Fimbriimonas ginsengisoli]